MEVSDRRSSEDLGKILPICRFCLDDTQQQSLVSPCSCAGSQKFVHLHCLRKWQVAVHDQPRATCCNVCQSVFTYAPPTELWSSKASKLFREVLPAFFALLGLLAVNHSVLFVLCIALFTLVCTKTFAYGALLLVSVFASLICFEMRGSRPIIFTDENGRSRVALLNHQERVAGLASGAMLVASELIHSGVFQNSVILLLEHGDDGSRGIIINSPAPIVAATRHALLAHFRRQLGGPVPGHVLLHTYNDITNATPLRLGAADGQAVYLGGDPAAIAERFERDERLTQYGSERLFAPCMFVGVATWSTGQLDREVRAGLWGWHSASLDLLSRALATDRIPHAVDNNLWSELRAALTLRMFRTTRRDPFAFPNAE